MNLKAAGYFILAVVVGMPAIWLALAYTYGMDVSGLLRLIGRFLFSLMLFVGFARWLTGGKWTRS